MKNRLHHFLPLLLITFVMLGCMSHPGVGFDSYTPTPIASVTGNTVTIQIGRPMFSYGYTRIHSRLVGNQLRIYGSITPREPKAASYEESLRHTVQLPPGIHPESLQIIWLNPGGANVPVPIRTK
jgi:hypothetical protein